jgi:5-carboxymethyl-2-hydroxymuconate isomerase
MPHFILEHSTNIDDKDLAVDQLFEKLHNTAAETGLFPLAGIRSRAHPCENFRVADGRPQYGFVHLMAKVGTGRSLEDLEHASQDFFAVLTEHFQSQSESRGFAISYEMTELPEVLKYNKNNLRDFMN